GSTYEFLQTRFKRRNITHDVQAHALRAQFVDFFFERLHEQPHEQRDFFLRPPPDLGTERKQCQVAHASAATRFDHPSYRLHAAGVAGRTRQKALRGPAPVAIHDDRQMSRHLGVFRDGKRGAFEHCAGAAMTDQTVMISASFWLTILSISATYLSVSFWTSSCMRRSSSSEISLSLTSFWSASLASRRRLRTATLASSPSPRTTLVRSRRRAAVSGGMGTRMLSPMEMGFRPRSDSRIAFSTVAAICFSQTCTLSVRASTTVTLATWFTGTGEP